MGKVIYGLSLAAAFLAGVLLVAVILGTGVILMATAP